MKEGGGIACITLTPSCDRLKFRDKTILCNGMCSNAHEMRLNVVVLTAVLFQNYEGHLESKERFAIKK